MRSNHFFSKIAMVVVILMLGVFGVQIGYCEVINVPDDFETIQAAIDEAENGDTVLVHPGTYVENIDFLGKDIVVGSLFLSTNDPAYVDSTIINGDSSGTAVVTFEGGETDAAVMSGFIITNGYTQHDGGGIYIAESDPSIANCIIRENSAGRFGGGIYLGHSNARLCECLIVANSARDGGAVYDRSSNPIFVNCTITENRSDGCGGISCNVISNNFLINTIVVNNNFPQLSSTSRVGADFIIAYCDIEGGEEGIVIIDGGEVYWLEGNIDADPLFVSPNEGDFTLSEDSPCINAGTAFFVWEDDTLVNLSPEEYFGDAPDMGAFESEFAGIESEGLPLPGEFFLHQNYPNPFNAVTTIRFDLPFARWVTLAVYDMQGREVAVLCEGWFAGGGHRAIWDASLKPNGIYLAKLVAGDEVRTVKFMLLK